MCFLVAALIADDSGDMINARDGNGLLVPDETDSTSNNLQEQTDDPLIVSSEPAQNADDQAGVENGDSVNNDVGVEESKPEGEPKEEPKGDEDRNEESKNDDDSNEEPKSGKNRSEDESNSDERPEDDDRKREPKMNGEDCKGKRKDHADQGEEILEIQQIQEIADLLETEDSDGSAAEEQTQTD